MILRKRLPGSSGSVRVCGLWARAAPRSANLRCATWAPGLEVALGDITAEHVDAVVNAANTSLLGGGGVDGAIHRAAGPRAARGVPRAERLRVRRRQGHPGVRAPRPVRDPHRRARSGDGGDAGEARLLASCYRRCLEVADEIGAASVAFPAISTGAYGYPVAEATQIAVATVRSTITSVEVVRFVCFDAAVHELYVGEIG